MNGENVWWDYLHFHLPNYALAVALYTLLGRFLLSFWVRPDSTLYIWVWFCRLTEPFLVCASAITPRYFSPRVLLLTAAFWMMAARVAFFIAMFAAGQVPHVVRGTGG